MKKKGIKSLKLNKRKISFMQNLKIRGGVDSIVTYTTSLQTIPNPISNNCDDDDDDGGGGTGRVCDESIKICV